MLTCFFCQGNFQTFRKINSKKRIPLPQRVEVFSLSFTLYIKMIFSNTMLHMDSHGITRSNRIAAFQKFCY